MSHLGERLSALVDGELGPADRDAALSHLAECSACRFEAEMLRQLKRRLHGLHEPQPAVDLTGRISAVTEESAEPREARANGNGSRGFLAGLMRRQRPAEQDTSRDAFGTRPPLGSRPPIGGGLPWTRGGHEPSRDDASGAAGST